MGGSIDPLVAASLPVGVFEVDLHLALLSANPQFCRLSGYGLDELLALKLTDLLDPGDAETAKIQAFGLGGEGPREHELRLRRKGGDEIWVRLLASSLEDRSGAVSGAVFLASDITDRKRSEDTKQILQQRIAMVAREWQLTFDAVSSPILLLDQQARILRMNRATMELSGRSYADNLMQPVGSLGTGEPWRACAEVARRVIAEGGSAQVSVEDRDAGRTWDLAASLVARDDRDEDSIIVIAKDVSELVALQRSLRRSELMSALGALVAGVAHEVRNPLFAMSATLDAFEACSPSDRDFREYIQILRDELARMSDLMRDLLEYGRPAEPRLAAGSIRRILRQAVEACQPLAERSQVAIEMRIAPGLPEVPLDELRITQVFKNLLENAVQHSRRGDRVEIDVTSEGGFVTCSIRDHGAGFKEEDLPCLFEPFFSRRRGGTGLGLALVRRIVEQHAGDVTCSNHREGGALIRVRIAAEGGAREDR
jgi:PAS domain S-box-containing protein